MSNMRAFRCDICSYLEYDAASLGRLEYLIDHPAPEYEEEVVPRGTQPLPPEPTRPLSRR